MSETSHCPECGAELPGDALGGLCPKCLLAAGLESHVEPGSAAGSGPEAPTTPHSGSFVPPDATWLAAHFPQLEILELLGHGGMGAVYKARQPKLDRLVALKIIRPEAAGDPAFAERFNREARMLARLSHPHIVAVYDFGSVDISLREMSLHAEREDYTAAPHAEREDYTGRRTLYFFLMEFVDGMNLRQLLETGELLPQQALAIVPQICEALQFAHDEGVVHRDIKPENILLDKRGRVKIADFGLAKLAASVPQDFTLTGTHQVMGTPRYMAPEQMEGSHAVDHRADIYSLGVVFYEMLTGEVPMGHFEPPSKKVEVDVRLDEVVLRALAREPARRYQQASEVKTDLEPLSQAGAVASAERRRGVRIAESRIASSVAHRIDRDETRGRSMQGSADALLVIGSLALLTAIGAALWLWLSPTTPLVRPVIIHNLKFVSVSYVVYSLFVVTAAILMHRLRARVFVLLSVTIAGIAFPAVMALNVIMQHEITPEWPIGLPIWLGVPIAAWATWSLFRPEIRDEFRRQRETSSRHPNQFAEGESRELRASQAAPQYDASRLVLNPAWGLIITGVISWITIPLAFAVPFIENMKDMNATQRTIFQISFGAIPLVVGTIMALAGFQMRRLEGYRLAIFAAGLPIVVLLLKLVGLSFGTLAIGPADLVGAPIGLWVLVVLSRSDVRDAFHISPSEQSSAPRTAPGTLGQAWDAWWAERDRWFTRTALTVLLVVHVGCLGMFLTLRGGGGYDSDRPSAWHHVGWPTPWFVYERGVESNVAFRRTINLLSPSIVIVAVGMLAWYAFWRVQLVRDAHHARFWQTIGSPTAVLIVWIIAGGAFAWLGVRDADRLYESMRAQTAPIESQEAAEAPGS